MAAAYVKNYTSSVPVERTVARIEALLIRAGARDIGKSYEPRADGPELNALQFRIPSGEPGGGTLEARLPVNVSAVAKALTKPRPTARAGRPRSADTVREQARRTAWRTAQDWLEVQLTLVALGQAELAEVFLPHLISSSGSTLYAALKEGGIIPSSGRVPLLELKR